MAVSIDGAGSVTGLDAVDVPVYADAAARDTAIASPTAGQIVFVTGTGSLVYNGTAWVALGAGAANFTNTATGDYVSDGISYKYITFTGTGSLTIDVAGLADVLLVAGGGSSRVGSSDTYRGGGGAGGMIYSASKYLAVGTHTVTVGAGGVIDSGGNSNFLDLYAIGGGNGQSGAATVKGVDGGSGSGASGGGRAPGSGVIGQGNDGGYSASAEAGGGGAGGAGSGSMAGVGLSNSITGSAVTYATGGADGTTSAANSGNGGNGDSAGVNGDSGVFIIRVAV